jgi:hypothetical protein
MRKISPAGAPTAMRIPISWVRAATLDVLI